MKLRKLSKGRISFGYRGSSVTATGSLATIIAYSLAGTLILFGIAAIQRAFNDRNRQLLQNQKQLQ